MRDAARNRATVAAVLVGTHLVTLAGIVWFASGTPDRFIWLIEAGGSFAVAVSLLALLQSVVGILLGWREMRRPVSMPVHLAAPAAAILVGLLGAFVGLREAAAWAPPPSDFSAWVSSAALADVPRFYGLTVGGLGLAAVCVTVAACTVTERRAGEKRAPALGTLVFGSLATCGAAVVVLALRWHWIRASTSRVLGPMLCVAALIIVLDALTARAPASHAQVGRLALSGVAGALAVLCLGVSKAGEATAAAMHWVASPPLGPIEKVLAPLLVFQDNPTYALAGRWLGAAALSTGLFSLLRRRAAFIRWASAERLTLAAMACGLVILAAVQLGYAQHRRAEFARLLANPRAARLPDGVALPSSSSSILLMPDGLHGLVTVHQGKVILDGQVVGGPQDMETVAAVSRWLRRPPDEVDASYDRPVPLKPGEETYRTVPTQRCLLLAAGASTQFNRLVPLLDRLVDAGLGKVKLLVKARRPDRPNEPDELRRRLRAMHGDLGLFEDVFVFQASPYNVVNTYAVGGWQTPGVPGTDDRLHLTLGLHDGQWALAEGRVPGPEQPSDDLSALGRDLLRIKEEHPDARAIFVRATGATTLQQLVDALDVAREADAQWGTRALFDDVRLMTREPDKHAPR